MTPTSRVLGLQAHPQDFAPALLKLQQSLPSPLPRLMLWTLCALTAAALLWATFGTLDIVAVAPGKLVPRTYVKVVQPADAGIIQDILVREGDKVEPGQVLARMDPSFVQADIKTLANEVQVRALQLRRIEAELQGTPPTRHAGDSPELYSQVLTQYQARRQAYLDSVATEQSLLNKVQQDLNAALEVKDKLARTLPIYEDQERSWAQLHQEGFAGRLLAEERKRQRIEAEQELKAQTHSIEGYKATIEQSTQRLAQLRSTYRQQLMNEKVETSAQLHRLTQEADKQARRGELLELRAPQAGIVKELATHTTGAVLQPGTVLMTIVPTDEQLQAEVWVDNEDVGFVREGQEVKVKVAPYPFQKYGMIDGTVQHVSADASEQEQRPPGAEPRSAGADREQAGFRFRGIVALAGQTLTVAGQPHALSPGMQVQAEIKLGERTVLEYLLSPVQKAWQEAGRER